MKRMFAVALVALLFCVYHDGQAEENELLVFRYPDAREGIFEYKQGASMVYVWDKSTPKKGEKAFFSGLITEDTVIYVIDKTCEPKQVLHTELQKLNGRRVAAFGKFYKVENKKGEIRLLRIDRLLVVVLPNKGGI